MLSGNVTALEADPVGPTGPVGPVYPKPVGPVGPVCPVVPLYPVGPVGPVCPVGPIGPVGPAVDVLVTPANVFFIAIYVDILYISKIIQKIDKNYSKTCLILIIRFKYY